MRGGRAAVTGVPVADEAAFARSDNRVGGGIGAAPERAGGAGFVWVVVVTPGVVRGATAGRGAATKQNKMPMNNK